MDNDSNSAPCSRRSFLNGGAAFVAGGLVGSAAGIASAGTQSTAQLPWPWAKIDPLEAGRRSFRNYHEHGG